MALDIEKLKNRLSSLSNTNNPKSKMVWKPTPGQKVIRIVPNAKSPGNPFVELKFHYNMNGKTYLSPDTFNRPDPIVEFSNKLKTTGDKEDWKDGKKLEPKMRTYVPILVRGEEELGVRFWGFGKKVYEQILSVIADPDYGDITDLATGRDIVVEFKSAQEVNKDYPETSIRVKLNQSPAVDPTRKDLIDRIKNQPDILECWPEMTYDELKGVLTTHLHPEIEDADNIPPVTIGTTYNKTEAAPVAAKTETVATAPAQATKAPVAEDLTKAFDDLFGKK